MTIEEIKNKANEIYNKEGQSAVFDFANEQNCKFAYCKACETSSPSIDGECLVCGETTSNKLSDAEKELLKETLNEHYNLMLKLIKENSSLISNDARKSILKNANEIDDLRIKLLEIL